MKNLLVPIDFSKQAIDAFRMALEIQSRSKGQVNLLHVIELPVMTDPLLMPNFSFEGAFLEEMKSKAEKQFEKLIEKYAKGVKKINFVVYFGPPSRMILGYIEEHDIDLVLMGSKGASGVKEVLIGSNAEKIVRRSSVPVVVIKKYKKLSSIRNIVFPNTLEQDQEDLTLKVKALQNFFGAKLHIVFVNTPSNFTRDIVSKVKLEAFAKRFMIKDYTLHIYNDVFEESGVIHFAQSIKADMIAMGTHGRKGMNHFIGGSIAEDVVNHFDEPVWTLVLKD